ncbi:MULTISPECIES: DNA gyrase subunit B [unclassified Streptomyces]|uniref:DNA gyrase subunit B n=1 Tax=unclassified Streptomyces TaxID=2593676 RepID=UPI002E80B96C|nr:DNA gyrase subunit B [Streptomyces sp. NBC_00589]WTI33790.1 ATP-binding protein [Streptomyces sp. NBC_00775]WUB32537.1 ATP-binding protein [Streptomyces sp. NBC_00589]
MREEAIRYDASHIQVLEGWEAIRKRPGMYVGSTGERGLHQLLFEVAGRAVNEVLAGRAGSVEVALTPHGGVRVADDGPGVPVEATAGDTDGPGLEALLTRMHAGAGPGGRHTAAMSLFGTGPCVTNALSSRLTAEVRREGVRWVQEYARGVALTPPTAVGPATGSGTTIAFWPDTDIFGTAECSYAVLEEHFRQLAFLNQGLSISLTDERPPGGSRPVRFQFPGGVRDFVAFLDTRAGAPVHPDVIGFEREDPRMAGTVEVALRWCGSREERVRSFANSVLTPDGGTHAMGFRDGVAAAVTSHARQRRLLAAADPDLGADRIGEGLTAVVSVKLDSPVFLGATHGTLGGAAVRACVAEAVRDHLGTWLEGHPEQAAAVVGRIVRGTRRN